jgi:hypothetical protein
MDSKWQSNEVSSERSVNLFQWRDSVEKLLRLLRRPLANQMVQGVADDIDRLACRFPAPLLFATDEASRDSEKFLRYVRVRGFFSPAPHQTLAATAAS